MSLCDLCFQGQEGSSFPEELIGIYIADAISAIIGHVPFSHSLPGSSGLILQSSMGFAAVGFAY